MNYLELYKIQLGSDKIEKEKYYSSAIFTEYCGLNCFLNDINRSNKEIKESIEMYVDGIEKPRIESIEDSVSLLKSTIEDYEKSNHPLFSKYNIDGVIFLLGDTTVDSQGIILKDKSYMIVDLLAYDNAKEKYNPKSFVIHEIVHPIHYKLNPEMYFRNYKGRMDTTVKRIFIEGLATYLTKYYTDESDTDIFWLGYLDEQGVDKWIDYSDKRRHENGVALENILKIQNWERKSQIELFSISNSMNRWEGRVAYYYGYEITKELMTVYTVNEILNLKYNDLKPYVQKYFKVSNVG